MKALEFFKDVRREFSRINWPSNKEVLVSSGVVVLVVVVFALVFTVFDALIFKAIRFVLNIG